MVGGSADLTGSNNTFVKGMKPFDAPDYAGRYVHYGVREFGMAAAMNGMALHGGVIPYSGTFLAFADYSRPAIRLGALMGAKVIHVMTHDSIGLGEDGPTHQPVEHVASLRAIPNLLVFRPADAVETAECWKIALQQAATPSVMCLSRQKVPGVRDTAAENLSAKGAYELLAAEGGEAAGDDLRLGHGSLGRRGGPRHPAGPGQADPRRLHPLLGAVRSSRPPPTRPR
jgi:transketolase